jgi:RNA polymerase sigma-54 factor
MKPVIQLKLGQQLTMTPQLQQAIKLLQLSSIDLQQTIQTTLEINPLLEVYEPETLTEDETPATSDLSAEDLREQDSLAADEGSWESLLYPDPYLRSNSQNHYDKPGFDIDNQREKDASLKDHLLWQMELAPLSARDHAIANFVIDAINDEGYLIASLEELQKNINQQALTDLEEPVDIKEIEIVLHQIQQFDPLGVGARDLKECLLLQLNQFSTNMPDLKEMKYMIENHLPLLAKKNYPQLKSKMKIKEQRLKALLKKLKILNPKPGLSILSKKAEYIIPDVIVKKSQGKWVVNLNTEFSPHIRINPSYAALVKRADNSRDNLFLKEQLTEARWFLKSLQNRHETLLRVSACIVEKQKDFLEKGPEAMKPLILRDIASELDLHESTISRITTKKYLLTPRGTFELKHFFSSHLHKAGGEECSSTAIRAFIKKIIANEAPKNPLSDHAIAKLLAQEGIPIARRTVAKYRETLAIPASHDRKCFSEEN